MYSCVSRSIYLWKYVYFQRLLYEHQGIFSSCCLAIHVNNLYLICFATTVIEHWIYVLCSQKLDGFMEAIEDRNRKRIAINYSEEIWSQICNCNSWNFAAVTFMFLLYVAEFLAVLPCKFSVCFIIIEGVIKARLNSAESKRDLYTRWCIV